MEEFELLQILVAEPENFSAEALAVLQRFANVALIGTPQQSLRSALEAYDVLWLRLGLRVRAEDFPQKPRCRFIVCPATGLDHIDLKACDLKGIQVLSLRGEQDFLKNIRATAELTIGLALAVLRRIPQASAHVLAGGWQRDLFRGHEIYEKTVGIAGMGRLGKITAQMFRSFGCRVLGYDPQPFEEAGISVCKSLEELVSQSDLVSIHINYSPENHHLFNDALFSKFKKNSLLINTSRGGLVDSKALIRHLESGHLAGAALDVIEHEHIPAASPLVAYARKHENLLLTPHIGGNTAESFVKTEVFLAEKLENLLTAERPVFIQTQPLHANPSSSKIN